MDPLDFIKVLAVTFVTLFPVVNPIGDAPIFLSLTRQYPQSAQDILARKIAAYGFVLLAVSFLFGSEILSFFGITLVVIQITGGLIVASTGWSLLNQQVAASSGEQASDTLEGRPAACLLSADAPHHRRPGLHLHRDHTWRTPEAPGRFGL